MDLRLLARLSFRNVLRHRRRTAMLIAAIVVAVAGVVSLNTLMRGMQFDMRDSAVANLTGHMKVHAPGYRDDPSMSKGFAVAEDWHPDVADEDLVGWAARIRVPAVIMSERETRGIEIVGIDPAEEHISFMSEIAFEGEALKGPEDRRVFVGKALVEQLDTKVGRRLVLITQGADGLNREAGFRIAGVYDAEGTGLEKRYVFTGRRALQDMLDTRQVTEVSIRLQEDPEGPGLKTTLLGFFVGLEVLDWRTLEPQAAAMFQMADLGLFIWFVIMMGALIFGLVNSFVTAVMERVKELGMLRAVGMKSSAVVVQVLMESMLLMVIGVGLGVFVGWLVYLWLADGIDLTQFGGGMEMFGVSAVLTPKLFATDVVGVAIASLVFGALACLYPAWRAVKISPLEAMRR